MKESNPLPIPMSPCRTVYHPKSGITATAIVGSYADYLQRMEVWLLRELEDAETTTERTRCDAAIAAIRRKRQSWEERQKRRQRSSG